MEAPNLFDQVNLTGEDAIRAAFAASDEYAVDDRSGPELLCLAVERLYDVAILAEGLRASTAILEDPTSWLLVEGVRELRDVGGEVLQLLLRALDTEARETGFAPDVWQRRALRTAAIALRGDERAPQRPDVGDATRAATVSVAAALRDGRLDRMAVPGHLSSAIGCAAALFMLASAVLERSDVR
ncbi:MAG TPA: hypothetical protein VNS09_19215 [Solirubrobacter sp.]|nr:hypothetical protein [Solirubrobacter sp.]